MCGSRDRLYGNSRQMYGTALIFHLASLFRSKWGFLYTLTNTHMRIQTSNEREGFLPLACVWEFVSTVHLYVCWCCRWVPPWWRKLEAMRIIMITGSKGEEMETWFISNGSHSKGRVALVVVVIMNLTWSSISMWLEFVRTILLLLLSHTRRGGGPWYLGRKIGSTFEWVTEWSKGSNQWSKMVNQDRWIKITHAQDVNIEIAAAWREIDGGRKKRWDALITKKERHLNNEGKQKPIHLDLSPPFE